MTTRYLPFSEATETDEWTYTTAARVACASCGEWVYPRRKGDSGPFALPATCPVCDGPVADTAEPVTPQAGVVGAEPDRDDGDAMTHG